MIFHRHVVQSSDWELKFIKFRVYSAACYSVFQRSRILGAMLTYFACHAHACVSMRTNN